MILLISQRIRCAVFMITITGICASPLLEPYGPNNDVLLKRIDEMISFMNKSFDPCNNFYQYACGNFDQVYPIPDDEIEWHNFNVVKSQVDASLRELLEAPEDESTDNEAEIKTKRFYKSCVNTEAIDKRGAEPLLKFINNLGGMPVLGSKFNGEQFDWRRYLVHFNRIESSLFLSFSVFYDLENPEAQIPYIESFPSNWLTEKDYYEKTNSSGYNRYVQFVAKVLTMLGAEEAAANHAAVEITDLEGRVDKLVLGGNIDEHYYKTKIKNLNEEFGGQHWAELLNSTFNNCLDPEQEVAVIEKELLKNISNIFAETSSETVANYIYWVLIDQLIIHLDTRFFEEKQKFLIFFTGKVGATPRWKDCLETVKELLAETLGSLYVKHHFDEESKRDIVWLAENLKPAFKESFQSTDWFKESTKEKSLAKINAMKLFLGYKDDLINTSKAGADFEELKIHVDKYFENVLTLKFHNFYTVAERLIQPVDPLEWGLTPFKVDAGYLLNKNRIEFPAAILQPPFYHRSFPKVLNFGGIGSFIGHEITHGLVERGQNFDPNGVFASWWDVESMTTYNDRRQCFIDQYSSYQLLGQTINGTSSVSENIPDNVGLGASYIAYKKWRETDGNETGFFPGIDLTEDQIFFLSFAQLWCGSIRPESLKRKIINDAHCPTEVRVLGTISNSKYFAEAYHCPLGSPMNPEEKCVIW